MEYMPICDAFINSILSTIQTSVFIKYTATWVSGCLSKTVSDYYTDKRRKKKYRFLITTHNKLGNGTTNQYEITKKFDDIKEGDTISINGIKGCVVAMNTTDKGYVEAGLESVRSLEKPRFGGFIIEELPEEVLERLKPIEWDIDPDYMIKNGWKLSTNTIDKYPFITNNNYKEYF